MSACRYVGRVGGWPSSPSVSGLLSTPVPRWPRRFFFADRFGVSRPGDGPELPIPHPFAPRPPCRQAGRRAGNPAGRGGAALLFQSRQDCRCGVLIGIAVAASAASLRAEENLVQNGDFKAADAKRSPPVGKSGGRRSPRRPAASRPRRAGCGWTGRRSHTASAASASGCKGSRGKAYAVDALVARRASPIRCAR